VYERRRDFLRFLLASPLLAGAWPALDAHADALELITSVDQALDVFDFERAAARALPPAHWGYLATGVDDEQTLAANRAGFARYALRVRRMVDVSAIDTRITLFGRRWESPLFLSPVSSQQAFHAEGELASARASRTRGQLQVLSTLSSCDVERVIEARGEAGLWFQLYPTDQWDVTAALLKRVEAAGCEAVVLTVDLNGGSNRETLARARRADTRDCGTCHREPPGSVAHKAMFRGIDTTRVKSVIPQTLTWADLQRLRALWPRRLLLKGIVTREDAELAVRHGLDGVIVSNHGGRAEESGRSTIEALAEVVAGVRRRIPVLIDSGFRRGTDVFKALALGASAVGIGRPYVWGLAAFGEPGVEAVLRLLQRELETAMRQVGTRSIAEIDARVLVGR
jgi:4-hydroxymandelate oxidase